jgi:peptidoglycan/LPS O-acetylase OafA/YrhL
MYIKNLLVGYPFNFVPILVAWYIISPIISRSSKPFAMVLIIGIGIYQIILINLLTPGILGIIFPEWMNILIPKVLGTPIAQWGLFFPLGLFISLYSESIIPWIKKFKFLFIGLTITLFGISIASSLSLLMAPWWISLACPLSFMPLLPLIRRKQIPFFHFMEKIGVNSYGIYLTNLIILEVCLFLIKLIMPWLLNLTIILLLVLFTITLSIPLLSDQFIKQLQIKKSIAWHLGRNAPKPN